MKCSKIAKKVKDGIKFPATFLIYTFFVSPQIKELKNAVCIELFLPCNFAFLNPKTFKYILVEDETYFFVAPQITKFASKGDNT